MAKDTLKTVVADNTRQENRLDSIERRLKAVEKAILTSNVEEVAKNARDF